MSADGASGGLGGVLSVNLLAPLRLPERVLGALDGLAESARELGPIRSELTRVREQTEPLGELIDALEHVNQDLGGRLEHINQDLGGRLDGVREVIVALESDQSHLNRTAAELGAKVGALHDTLAPLDERLAKIERTTTELAGEVGAIHETLRGVKDDIQRTTGLRGQRGVMERTRDALTGGNH